ncbi:MAG: hypothetical protein MRJ93_03475 [Nitrososphaeraceae archaeon]|nr:hypothetical protein [Nitrososphaeraceae archaeon]
MWIIKIPNKRTFDRRLATISRDIKNRISIMGEFFVHDKIIDPSVLSTDSMYESQRLCLA